MANEQGDEPTTEDVFAIFRLIHELCSIGSETHIWRERMTDELRRMVDADFGVSYVMKSTLDPTDIGPKTLAYVELGTNEFWRRYVGQGDLSIDPMTPHIMQRFGTDFTFTRHAVIEDAEWYGSAFYKTVLVNANWDQAIYSQMAIAEPSAVDGIGLCRAIGKPRFTPREISIVRVLHQELARLWRQPDPLGAHTLPARQRAVLDGIRRGDSRKAIAEKMDVSQHTVHSYEKALFRRANVNSRGSLLAMGSSVIRPNLLP